MSKVKEVMVGIGTPALPPEAVAKFEEAAAHHGSTQKAFLEGCKIAMKAMKKWYKNDEERAFEVVKKLASPICYKHMSESTFSSFCSTTRKLLHYKLQDWSVAKANCEVLDEAKAVADKLNNGDDTYGKEHLTYEQVMRKEVERIKEANRKNRSGKIPNGLECVAPDPRQYETVEEFTAAVWEFFNFYLGHEDLEDALNDDTDLERVKKIATKHAPVEATAEVA